MKTSIFKLITSEVAKLKITFFVTLFLTVVGAMITSWNPNIVGEIIDVALAEKSMRQLTHYVICLILFLFGGNLCVICRQYLASTATAKISESMTKTAFKKILDTHYSFFLDNQNGDILQRITKDIKVLQDLQIDLVLGFGYDVVLAVCSMVAVLRISWILGVVGLVVYSIYLLPTRYMGKLLKKYSNVLRNRSANLKEVVIEKIKDVSQIKIYGTENEEYAQICEEQDKWGKSLHEKYIVDQSGRSFPRILDALIPALVFLIGGYELFEGKLSVGNLVAITVYLPYVNKPIKSFTSIYFQLKDVGVRLKKIEDYMNLTPEESNSESSTSVPLVGKIEFKNVSVVNERGVILDDVSFIIHPGEHVALVGATGSGKSTILKLITRLLEPSSGEIFIDDQPLNLISVRDIRKRVGNILQDTFVFTDTVENNIRYLNRLAEKREMESLVKGVDLEKVINNLSNGYQTVVGENGILLSGGQKQRIGIVRALLRPMDLLLMDEATSALDLENEMKVHKVIMDKMYQKTCVYTAHRLETVVDADNILVIKTGQIIERGTHESLLKLEGYYYRLWQENSNARMNKL